MCRVRLRAILVVSLLAVSELTFGWLAEPIECLAPSGCILMCLTMPLRVMWHTIGN